jgi:tetratricopeptide (TPR) repeat protein
MDGTMARDGVGLSLCMVVRDEALLIEQAIASVRDAVDEIVVLDTGSTDRTPEIAAACGARVHHQAWDGRFASARNAVLELARGAWVLILDGDERIAVRDAARLRALTGQAATVGYTFLVHNYTRGLDLLGDWHPNRGGYPGEEHFSECPGYSRFRVARLFRRHPAVRYSQGWSTHTNPLASLRALGTVRDADVVIHHFQHRKGGEAFVADKQRQRLRLEQRHLRDHPADGLAHLNVGRTLFALGDDAEALAHLDRAVALDATSDAARLTRAIARVETGSPAGAVDDLYAVLERHPEHADAWTVLGIARHALDQPAAARAALIRAIALRPWHPVAHNSLGVLLLECGDVDRAADHFRHALAILPDFAPARANLASLAGDREPGSIDA